MTSNLPPDFAIEEIMALSRMGTRPYTLGRVPFGFTDAGFGDVFWRSTESVSFWSFGF